MDVALPRCLAVWLAVTSVCLGVGWWAAGEVHAWTSFDTVLPVGAACVLIACAVWAWGVTTAVVVGLVRHHAPSRAGWARRCVLAACGVALVGAGQVVPAEATPGHIVVGDDRTAPGVGIGALEGLALPGRTSGALTPSEGPTDAPATVSVRAGDSLWVIAESLLAPAATTAQIAGLVSRLHDLNRTEIGSDPDLIFPGQQLRTPLGERPAR